MDGMVNATRRGVSESGVMSKAKMLSKSAVGHGWGFIKYVAPELAEENIIEVTSLYADMLEGVDPGAVDKDNIIDTMAQTSLQTVMTMGLLGSTGAIGKYQRSKKLEEIISRGKSRRELIAQTSSNNAMMIAESIFHDGPASLDELQQRLGPDITPSDIDRALSYISKNFKDSFDTTGPRIRLTDLDFGKRAYLYANGIDASVLESGAELDEVYARAREKSNQSVVGDGLDSESSESGELESLLNSVYSNSQEIVDEEGFEGFGQGQSTWLTGYDNETGDEFVVTAYNKDTKEILAEYADGEYKQSIYDVTIHQYDPSKADTQEDADTGSEDDSQQLTEVTDQESIKSVLESQPFDDNDTFEVDAKDIDGVPVKITGYDSGSETARVFYEQFATPFDIPVSDISSVTDSSIQQQQPQSGQQQDEQPQEGQLTQPTLLDQLQEYLDSQRTNYKDNVEALVIGKEVEVLGSRIVIENHDSDEEAVLIIQLPDGKMVGQALSRVRNPDGSYGVTVRDAAESIARPYSASEIETVTESEGQDAQDLTDFERLRGSLWRAAYNIRVETGEPERGERQPEASSRAEDTEAEVDAVSEDDAIDEMVSSNVQMALDQWDDFDDPVLSFGQNAYDSAISIGAAPKIPLPTEPSLTTLLSKRLPSGVFHQRAASSQRLFLRIKNFQTGLSGTQEEINLSKKRKSMKRKLLTSLMSKSVREWTQAAQLFKHASLRFTRKVRSRKQRLGMGSQRTMFLPVAR